MRINRRLTLWLRYPRWQFILIGVVGRILVTSFDVPVAVNIQDVGALLHRVFHGQDIVRKIGFVWNLYGYFLLVVWEGAAFDGFVVVWMTHLPFHHFVATIGPRLI